MEVIQNINVEPDGWKLGEFQILFISMGQGDCCLITCPDGRHVMIDCGTKAGEKEEHQMYHVAKDLRSEDQLGRDNAYKNKLEALILTHPDKDHISKVKELLAAKKANFFYREPPKIEPKTGSKKVRPITKHGASDPIDTNIAPPESFESIDVEKVFFSDFRLKTEGFVSGPLAAYGQTGSNGCSDIIYNTLKPKELARVTINATEKVLHTWKEPYTAVELPPKDLSLEKCVVVCEGTRDNKNWSVKIIAGGVPKGGAEDPGDSEGRNAASLVTFIEYGADRILICGDATISTQTFLLRSTFRDKLGQGLSLIQVPHHGSDETQFHEELVNHCKPKRAVISVQKYEHSHHLPGKTSFERAEEHANSLEKDKSLPVCYWEKKTRDEFEIETRRWSAAGYEIKVEKDSQGRPARWVRQTNGQDFRGEGVVVLDGLNDDSDTKYFLIQKKTKKNVQQTSMQSHIWHYFDGSGT